MKKLEQINIELSEIQSKVVIDSVPKEELFEALKIELTVEKTENKKALHIYGSVSNHYVPDIPEQAVIATDGMLNVEIYHTRNDRAQPVDTIPLALPLYGVSCKNGTERVGAFSDKYVEIKGEYTLKVNLANLWLVEV